MAGATAIGGSVMGSAAEPPTDLAQTMAREIMGTTSHAEALRALRAAFPDSSLALRVAALATLMHRAPADKNMTPDAPSPRPMRTNASAHTNQLSIHTAATTIPIVCA